MKKELKATVITKNGDMVKFFKIKYSGQCAMLHTEINGEMKRGAFHIKMLNFLIDEYSR